jgi:RNA polymerase sigma-70 factor, ECF subfamily
VTAVEGVGAAMGPDAVPGCADSATADEPGSALTSAVGDAQRGDEPALVYLYRRINPGLERYLAVLVGPDAEDVASETWAQVCRDLSRFSGDGAGFRGWVATIGRNRAFDHLRARGRRPVDPVPVESLHHQPAADDTAASALEMISTESALALIATLPRDQAEAVLLRAVLGLDAAAAGKVMGKRPGTVRVAAHRGLRALAERLAAGDQS